MRSDSSSFRSDMSSLSETDVADLKAWEEPLLALHQQIKVSPAETWRRDKEQRLEAVTTQRSRASGPSKLHGVFSKPHCHRSFKTNKLLKVVHKTGVAVIYLLFKNPFGLFN